MFLNKLSSEEKKDFMILAIRAAEINGVVEEEEETVLQEYCREMMIAMPDPNTLVSVEELEKRFSSAVESHKRIVVFELLGLMYVDGLFDEEETLFVKKFVKGINMSTDVFAKLVRSMDQYVEVLTEISENLLLDDEN